MARRKRVHVEMEGVGELRAALARLDVVALRRAKAAIQESALDMLGEAQARVPIGDTRRLYDSLKVIQLDGGLIASIGTAYYKAKFHEFGTVKMAPSPFIAPAWEITRPKYLRALEGALQKAGREVSNA